ncbi:LacI family DNA-binding transcriptional regulator [Listeria sp. PSOL-1]|uniref:LacI family DNA-binding transcriptional regulator n=1 Tax=Listeria sp. PSOL-1 TaxID=1844999 RepID=UPI0013D6DFDD|nr:LacI family DNA-binding transcriptional regulator [Listeria sp. PSOL-1]
MTNIKEIAKLAGVSVTTVSRVLNEHPYVAEDKRSRVLHVIEKLDYTPNRSARNLARGRTNTVGVILPYNDHPWFDKVANGILEAAFQEKYSVIFFPTNYDPKIEEKNLLMLKTKQVDGLIITSRANSLEKIVPFTEYGPIILNEYTDIPEFSCAYVDRLLAFCEGFSFLKENGNKRVTFTTGRDSALSPSTAKKIEAYQTIFDTIEEDDYLLDCYTVEDGYLAAQYFFEEAKWRPDAIYANGDEVAAGMLLYAEKRGLRVPEDVAILGQENLPISRVLHLTTLDHHLKELGKTAFNIFFSGKIRKQKIAHSLIKRSTV